MGEHIVVEGSMYRAVSAMSVVTIVIASVVLTSGIANSSRGQQAKAPGPFAHVTGAASVG